MCFVQCLSCGKSMGNAKTPPVCIPWFDEQLKASGDAARESYYARRSSEFRSAAIERDAKWWTKYNTYLASPEWRRKRDAVLKRDDGVCQACTVRQAGQVHHLTYKHVFDEPLFDLVAVCYQCHEKITKMDRGTA
jgi:hypothetical protein